MRVNKRPEVDLTSLNDSWPMRELISGHEVTLSLHESPTNMHVYGKSLMKMLSVLGIEIQLSSGTKHSAIGDNLLALFLKRKWVTLLCLKQSHSLNDGW